MNIYTVSILMLALTACQSPRQHSLVRETRPVLCRVKASLLGRPVHLQRVVFVLHNKTVLWHIEAVDLERSYNSLQVEYGVVPLGFRQVFPRPSKPPQSLEGIRKCVVLFLDRVREEGHALPLVIDGERVFVDREQQEQWCRERQYANWRQ